MEKRSLSALVLVTILMASVMSGLVTAAVLQAKNYSPFTSVNGVIEQDRYDFMNADGNPLNEDIANAVFQGPGVFNWLKEPYYVDSIEIRNDTVGFMKDIYLILTGYGTLTMMNYTGEEKPDPEYHWLPVIEQNPPCSSGGLTPLEGWAIAYNMSVWPIGYDEGYLVFTFSGFEDGLLYPNVIGKDSDDNWVVTVERSTWVDNPRLVAFFYDILANNTASRFEPAFNLQIVIIFNKATKFVEIFQNLELVDAALEGCISVELDMALARMAIFDANPYCDRAFYGWKNDTIGDPVDYFIVLSWTNETLSKWVRADKGWDYYGTYMASYPIPDSFAIGSTWYDSNDTGSCVDACNIWHAPQLRFTPVKLEYGAEDPIAAYLDKYVFLYMGDIDGDDKGDGDQALTRVEWYSDASGMPEDVIGTETGWKLVMYGVYDVGNKYDGGEGGWFDYGFLCLSNNSAFEDDLLNGPNNDSDIVPDNIYGVSIPSYVLPPDPWYHTGSLGWLNRCLTGVNATVLTENEDMLTKLVYYLDVDQDGNKDADEDDDLDDIVGVQEYNIPYWWWPTEELNWQLTYKFAPPLFKKIPPWTCCMWSKCDEVPKMSEDSDVVLDASEEEVETEMFWIAFQYDFMVLPAPGATPDAAGAAWLNSRFTSQLVTFDVETYDLIATVGYVNPATKMLPYLMLRLSEIPTGTEDYSARRAHYLTADGRALPQMEWEYLFGHCGGIDAVSEQMDGNGTPWKDKHWLAVSVAGVHPNLATYYFNDFTPITRAIGGDYQWDLVVLPYGGPVDIWPYVGTDEGLGVVALAKDHFGNIALLVYGLDAQDTYWTAFLTTHDWSWICDPYLGAGSWSAFIMSLDYKDTGNDWGTGIGIPSAHPSYWYIWEYSFCNPLATEYEVYYFY